MRKPCAVIPAMVSFIAFLPVVGEASRAGEPLAYAINNSRYLDPHQYQFPAGTLRAVDVVGLGESIHLTHEFPLVRTGMVQFLSGSLGFQVVALEGSAADLWATQGRLLASRRTEVTSPWRNVEYAGRAGAFRQ